MSVGEAEQDLVEKVNQLKSVRSSIIGDKQSAVSEKAEKQRIKKKASAPNSLASAKARPQSVKSLKKKQSKFRRA